MDYLNSLLPTIEHFRLLGYWIIFLISIMESLAFIGLFIPGTVFLVAIGGTLCAKGVLSAGDVIWFSAVGAVVGDMISFYLGRHGTRLASRWEKIIHSTYMDHGERFLAAHGNKSVFLGRFIGPIRPILPFAAGFFRMPPQRFLFWDILSAPCWATTYVCMGYFFGQAWEFSTLWTSRSGILLISLLIILGILYFLRWEIMKRGREFFAFIRSLWGSFTQSLAQNPSFQLYVRHHPVLFRVIARRIDRRALYGLPLTLIGVALMYILCLYLGLIEDLMTTETLVGIDMRLSNLLAVFRHPHVTRALTWITLLGKDEIIIAFALIATLLLILWRRTPYIMPLWLTLLGSESFNMLSKQVFQRPRPAVALYPEMSSSFPSGHACLAVAFYGFILSVLFKQIKSYTARMNLLFSCLVIMLSIGFSRIYLGVHFLSDVWAGYMLGGLWLLIGMSLAEWEQPRIKTEEKAEFQPGMAVKAASVGLVGAGMIFYGGFAYRYVLPEMPNKGGMPPAVLTDNIPMLFELQHLSRYTETLSGLNQEPLSVLILAKDDRELVETFQHSGWYLADAVDLGSLTRAARSVYLHTNYPNAPMPPSFWENRVQDFGFERPTPGKSNRQRHHARFWKSHLSTEDGRSVYAGTASLDIGALWGISHKIWPDIDKEREYLLHSLARSGRVGYSRRVHFVEPVKGRHVTGDLFFTDGLLWVISIQKPDAILQAP